MNKSSWSLLTLSFVLGCASQPMGDGSGSMSSALDFADAEVERHHVEIMNAPDVPRAMSETDEHEQRMRGILEQMHEAVSKHRHCANGGNGHMRVNVAALEQVQARHLDELHRSGSLPAIQAACAAALDDTLVLLEDMHREAAGSCMR